MKSNLSFVMVDFVKDDQIKVIHNSTEIRELVCGACYNLADVFHEDRYRSLFEMEQPSNLRLNDSFSNPIEIQSYFNQSSTERTGLWLPLGEINSARTNDLLASAAHDLRSPIHTILGLSNLIDLLVKSDEIDKEELLKIAQMIRSSCSDAIDFTNDVLEMSNIESHTISLAKEKVNLEEFIKHYINTHRLLALKKSISVNFINKLTGKSTVLINKTKITRVFDNLISNAIKFSPKGSSIEISLHEVTDGISITFRDHGIGMSDAVLKSIFTKFGKSRRKGLLGEKSHGLGMPIVKHIMDLHDGTIDISSKVNQGTEVNITFKK